MGNWKRTGWLLNQVPEGLAHPLRSGCIARHTQCHSRCRMQAKSQGRRCVLSSFVPNQSIYCACEPKIDITGVPAFPRWRRRAALRPARFHRRRVAAWRVDDCQCDAFEVRPVGLGCVQSDMGACAGHVLSFGWRKQSRF